MVTLPQTPGNDELTFVEQLMCPVLVSALCMYYISSYNLMGQGVSPFYRRKMFNWNFSSGGE